MKCQTKRPLFLKQNMSTAENLFSSFRELIRWRIINRQYLFFYNVDLFKEKYTELKTYTESETYTESKTYTEVKNIYDTVFLPHLPLHKHLTSRPSTYNVHLPYGFFWFGKLTFLKNENVNQNVRFFLNRTCQQLKISFHHFEN